MILATLIILLAILAAAFLVQHQRQNEKSGAVTDPRNVLVVMIDDLDEGTFDQMLDNDLLPNIAKYVVDEGTRFTNSFVTNSQCCPSRATFLTGKYSHNTGTWNVVGDEGGIAPFKERGHHENNLATWLSDRGYYNGFIGKPIRGTDLDRALPGWHFWRPVSGYDARPGQYSVHFDKLTQPGSRPGTPNVYQARYLADSGKEFVDAFISQRGMRQQFFLWLAPNAVHALVPSWSPEEIDETIPGSGEVVAFDVMSHPSGEVRQILIRGDGSTGQQAYARSQTNDNWTEWSQMDPSWFDGTGNSEIVAYNSFILPDSSEQHELIKGNKTAGYVKYVRTREGTSLTGWQLTPASSWQEGNGAKEIVGWSAYVMPNGVRRQEIVRGNNTQGYDLYYRLLDPEVTAWNKQPDGWDFDHRNMNQDDLVAWDSFMVSDSLVRHHVLRGNLSQGYKSYYIDKNSFYHNQIDDYWLIQSKDLDASGGAELKIVSNSAAKANRRAKSTAIEKNVSRSFDSPSLTYPANPIISRVYADGNWENLVAHQAFDIDQYGGRYPAGSLRKDGPDGMTPLKPEYDLPPIINNNDSFNATGCDEKPRWYCEYWIDLDQPALNNQRHVDFLRRLHLDRMESMISVDVMIGEILKVLESKGLLENTLIIFTSDNGFVLGEHRVIGKMIPHEASIRVPLVIRYPSAAAAQNFDQLAVNIDLAPTILEYAGLDWRSTDFNVDGRSLEALIQGRSEIWRDFFLVEHHYPRNMELTKTIHKLPDYDGVRAVGAGSSEGSYLYVEYGPDPVDLELAGDVEFYDMTVDINQLNNLVLPQSGASSGPQSSTELRLREALNSLRACSGESCRDDKFLDNVSSAALTTLSP